MDSNAGNGWNFVANNLTGSAGDVEIFSGGSDTAVSLQVILDPIGGEVWGRADFGSLMEVDEGREVGIGSIAEGRRQKYLVPDEYRNICCVRTGILRSSQNLQSDISINW